MLLIEFLKKYNLQEISTDGTLYQIIFIHLILNK